MRLEVGKYYWWRMRVGKRYSWRLIFIGGVCGHVCSFLAYRPGELDGCNISCPRSLMGTVVGPIGR